MEYATDVGNITPYQITNSMDLITEYFKIFADRQTRTRQLKIVFHILSERF